MNNPSIFISFSARIRLILIFCVRCCTFWGSIKLLAPNNRSGLSESILPSSYRLFYIVKGICFSSSNTILIETHKNPVNLLIDFRVVRPKYFDYSRWSSIIKIVVKSNSNDPIIESAPIKLWSNTVNIIYWL